MNHSVHKTPEKAHRMKKAKQKLLYGDFSRLVGFDRTFPKSSVGFVGTFFKSSSKVSQSTRWFVFLLTVLRTFF